MTVVEILFNKKEIQEKLKIKEENPNQKGKYASRFQSISNYTR